MSYQVLARKYRPRTFTEMVGQEHVLRALINALNQNRLHHAYLFAGTRGVGKTTLARILAKCLNCEQGVSAKPCEQCSSCQEINQGRFVDLIEVDAASRTKVEDTRELLENVQYPPHRGRYKVYLIDEVHMLSNHSFNALLKTLEEPPPYIIFLLATTDPQRLPVTVLSRCLQFNLKNLAAEKITNHLAQLLSQENISYELPALELIAKSANGSVRDALSLLDQAIAFGGGKVTAADAASMLGTIEQTQILELLQALAVKNAAAILNIIAQLVEKGADFAMALEDLLTLLHRIAVAQIVPTDGDTDQIKKIASSISPEDIQLYYQIGLIGRRDLALAPTPKSGFEMILLRMVAFGIGGTDQEKIGKNSSTSPGQKQKSNPSPLAGEGGRRPGEGENKNETWPQILNNLNLSPPTKAFAQHCSLKEQTADFIQLLLDPNHSAFHNANQENRLKEALSSYFGKPIRLQISIGTPNLATPRRAQQAKEATQLATATEALKKDPNVQTILELFDAKIETGSVQIKDPGLSSAIEN